MSSSVFLLLYFAIILSCFTRLEAQIGPNWIATPFNPPSLPIAVRSPYLSTWRPQGNRPSSTSDAEYCFWDLSTAQWLALVVVDGVSYRLMGTGNISGILLANQTAVEFTPTRTTFNLTAGTMDIILSFISPIEPTDLVRQSMPFSYLSISAASNDGRAHSLRIYSDVTGELMAGENSAENARWVADDSEQYIILSTELVEPQKYGEIPGTHQAADATEYFSFKKIDGTTTSWAIASDRVIHINVTKPSLRLGNEVDSAINQVFNGTSWPTLGIAVDLGNVSSTPEPAVWTIGLVRNLSVQYRTAQGLTQDRYPYFMSVYSDVVTVAKAFLDDFSRAQSAAASFDTRLRSAGLQYSENYADLIALVARQVMGTIDITLSKDDFGNWNMSDVKIFMKNIGNAGSDASETTMSVNTVETLYAAFPAFLYVNPELGGHLLSPLLEFQDSSAYLLNYAAKNIGSTYPNATADNINDPHLFGIEETANMLIMTLAYTQRSGNRTFLSKHYPLLYGWAEYLVNNTLYPTNQKSADFIGNLDASSSTNQTNLAVKGIIGIACMAEIANIVGAAEDKLWFNSTATSYISIWQSNTVTSDNSHLNTIYGKQDSNGLIYNLYADKLLQLNLVADSVYDVATTGYNTLAGQTKYGIPLQNDQSGQTTISGMILAASTVTNATVRDLLISQMYAYASSSQNNMTFPSAYDPDDGEPISAINAGQNSPTSGAIFSLLALNTPVNITISPSKNESMMPGGSPTASTDTQNKSKTNIGTIVGGTIGGTSLLVILFVLGLWCFRRYRISQRELKETASIQPAHFNIPPSAGTAGTPRSGLAAAINNPARSQDEKIQSQDAIISRYVSPAERINSGDHGSRGSGDAVNGNRELLQEENECLRQELDRIGLGNLPPSYSDPGVN